MKEEVFPLFLPQSAGGGIPPADFPHLCRFGSLTGKTSMGGPETRKSEKAGRCAHLASCTSSRRKVDEEMRAFTTMTTLLATPESVWQRVITPEEINAELSPWLRMTVPRAWKGKTLEAVTPATRLGRSWLLLFGVLPIDYDNIALAEWEPGRRFLEVSTMLSMQRWQHERSVLPRERGCIVQDQVSFALRAPLARLPGLERLCGALLKALFRHRHRRLLRIFSQEQ